MKLVASGNFELPLSARTAIGYFTPEGERDWVPGWDPVYPGIEPSEAPGTVFTTAAGGIDTIWLILDVDRDACHATYARVTPDRHAGTVRVSCTDIAPGSCRVEVTYEMSLLPGADPRVLDAYAEGAFQTMLGEWAAGVMAVI